MFRNNISITVKLNFLTKSSSIKFVAIVIQGRHFILLNNIWQRLRCNTKLRWHYCTLVQEGITGINKKYLVHKLEEETGLCLGKN